VSAWWIGATIVGFAALVQGVSGFAFGILSMALLTIVWKPTDANVVVTMLAAYSSLATLYSIRKGVRWQGFSLLFCGYFVGLPLGTRMLTADGTDDILRTLVALACLMIAYQNWFVAEPSEHAAEPPRWHGLLAGTASGFLSGAVSSGGAPILWYIYRRPWSRDELKATGLMMFFAANLSKLAFWGVHDLRVATADHLYTPERAKLALSYLPAVMLGSALGVLVFRFVDRRLLRRIVCILLVVMAAILLLRVMAA